MHSAIAVVFSPIHSLDSGSRYAAAAAAQAEPIADQRGTPEFKRSLINTLVKRGVDVARRRCRGETVEVSHEYY